MFLHVSVVAHFYCCVIFHYMNIPQVIFIYSPVDGCTYFFQFYTITNKGTLNFLIQCTYLFIHLWIYVFVSLSTPRIQIAKL